MPLRILIAEDDQDVAEILGVGVRITWPDCQVVLAPTGEAALKSFAEDTPDLVILDITMPPPGGFEVCAAIRQVSQVPILMLTARKSTVDKVRALDLGADDYLTKPFDHLELLARLRALVRRASLPEPLAVAANVGAKGSGSPSAAAGEERASVPTELAVGDLVLHTNARRVELGGKPVQLTSTEYRLLEELARNAGQVMTHAILIERVWGPEYAGEEHYLKVFVHRLRSKLEDDAENPRYIQSEWGVGYRFIPRP